MTRLAICSDSTSFWVRPRTEKFSCSYIKQLKNHSAIKVDLYSRPGLTSLEALSLTWNQIAPNLYDAYFFSFGINDLCPRSYPKWMADRINSTVIPNTLTEHIFHYFYRVISSKHLQKLFATLKMSKPWVSKKRFSINLSKIIEIIKKEEDAIVIFTTIPRVNSRVENILIGTNTNITEYNKVIRSFSGKGVYIIDLENYFKEAPSLYIPEGIHFSSEGHRLVYHQVIDVLLKK